MENTSVKKATEMIEDNYFFLKNFQEVVSDSLLTPAEISFKMV